MPVRSSTGFSLSLFVKPQETNQSCDFDSIDCAVLKQRSQEQTRRERERYENERRDEYERAERPAGEYLRNDEIQ